MLPPEKVAVYWIEHVLKQGSTDHLKIDIKRNMPFYSRYLFDVATFLFLAPLVLLAVIYKVARLVVSKLLTANPQSSQKVKPVKSSRKTKAE